MYTVCAAEYIQARSTYFWIKPLFKIFFEYRQDHTNLWLN